MRTAQMLDQTLKAAGLPIAGISIGKIADRSTWTVQWTSPPTLDQQRQADQVLMAFVPSVLVESAPDLTPDAVLVWCAAKLGVDGATALAEVVRGMTEVPKGP